MTNILESISGLFYAIIRHKMRYKKAKKNHPDASGRFDVFIL